MTKHHIEMTWNMNEYDNGEHPFLQALKEGVTSEDITVLGTNVEGDRVSLKLSVKEKEV